MDLRSLRFFLAVAKNNGVQKAAESLHLTQPNVSRTLKALEEELNAQLFVRTAHGVEITEEGELLRMRAEEILSLVAKTKAEVLHSKQSELSGEVRIAAGESEGMRNVIRAMSLLKLNTRKLSFPLRAAIALTWLISWLSVFLTSVLCSILLTFLNMNIPSCLGKKTGASTFARTTPSQKSRLSLRRCFGTVR